MNHRERVAADKLKHGPPPEYDDNLMLLLQCINSGQVEADQYVAHVEAGDLNQGGSDGRNTEN